MTRDLKKELDQKELDTQRNILFAEYLNFDLIPTATTNNVYRVNKERRPAFSMPFETDWNWTMMIVLPLLRDNRLMLNESDILKKRLHDGNQKKLIEWCGNIVNRLYDED